MKPQEAGGWRAQKKSLQHSAAVRLFFACLGMLLLLMLTAAPNSAKNDPRRVMVERSYLASHWQLARWHTGQTVCDIYSRQDGPPAAQEVVHFCGDSTYQEWFTTPLCNGTDCRGLMLRFAGRGMHYYQELVQLPRISFQVDPLECTPGQVCSTRPYLNITASEPVEGHRITRLFVRTPDKMWMYEGSHSLFELPLTGEKGTWLEYWAVSDLGDESERVKIRYRSVPLTGASGYQIDLLGEEWAAAAPSGSLVWDLFPALDRPLPKVLEQPLNPRYLATTNRYVYLSGQLIRAGKVDASGCPGGGFFPTGAVNACGEQASADQVLEWQNRYDGLIYDAAQRHHVPARVLKGIIAQESQFWPSYGRLYEVGLGMLTENGLDLVLTWNTNYFLDVCQDAYSSRVCSSGYPSLTKEQQLVLRGALLEMIGTDAEIDLLAATLAANAIQMRQLVRNTLLYPPADVTTYEDMWKITIGNYYAGSGCTGAALQVIANTDTQLNWGTVVQNLRGDCQIAGMYVERVFDLAD
jgi:hypothetical protein